jgi:hypothetical protein
MVPALLRVKIIRRYGLLQSSGSRRLFGWREWLLLSTILLLRAAFVLAFLPSPGPGYFFLEIDPPTLEGVHKQIAGGITKFFLPLEYPSGQFLWSVTSLPLLYLSNEYFGGILTYLLFSSLLIICAFTLSYLATGYFIFSATLAYMLALGTQLNYAFTYGILIIEYLTLVYMAINLCLAWLLIVDRIEGPLAWGGYAGSLLLLALSSEIWLDYAAATVAALGFGCIWAARHREIELLRRLSAIIAISIIIACAYVSLRLHIAPREFVRPGSETELLVTYSYITLIVEDFLVNFFTFLFTVLSNYLPASMTSSNSLTHLGKATILREQNGYDEAHQHLIAISHLTIWRFYAGTFATLFIGFVGRTIKISWHRASNAPPIIAGLCLAVLAGFATHLLIKMRPYNLVPALPYKVIISVAFFTVLVAYLTQLAFVSVRHAVPRWGVIITVWSCVLLAALTRPGMQGRLLAEVGLVGLGDPLGQLLHWLY